MSERIARIGLIGILAIFVVLASAYAYVTPTLEAPDEIHHYDYIRSLIKTGRPPVLEEGGGKGFGHHAPLYYAYGALVSFWTGEADLEARTHHNPFFGYRPGAVGRDNKNLYLHSDDDAFGSSDVWLSVRVVRWASVVLGAVTIWLIYRVGREVFPSRPAMALGAAGLSAFIPQFLFISGAVNDDNGATLFGAMALWAMMRILRRGPTWRRCIGLGLALGLGWLSKLTIVALVPTATVSLLLAVARHSTTRPFARSLIRPFVIVFGVAAVLIVPWLARQTILYGDPTGTAREMSEWGLREEPFALTDLGPDLYWLRTSFWGRLGYNQIPLAGWIYDLLDVITLLALLGLVSLAIRRLPTCKPADLQTCRPANLQLVTLTTAFLLSFGPMIVRRFLRPMPNFGRYLFPVLPSIALLMVTGLSAGIPRRRHPHLATGLSVAMLALGVAGLTHFLAPAYARPPIHDADAAPKPTHRLDWVYLEDDQPLARLRGYDVKRRAVEASGTAKITLYWEVLDTTSRNHVLFAQLFGRGGTKVGQRDTYPGLGHYPTSFWHPGQVIVDDVPIPIAPDAEAPSRLRLDLGLYERGSGQRLRAVDASGDPVDSPTAGWLKLTPLRKIPPPDTKTDYRLGESIALIGYDLAQEGDRLKLALHWACLAPMERDYTAFVHLLNAEDKPAAQADGPPLGGDYPTTFWSPGEVIVDERVIPTGDLPPGDYHLSVGMYLLTTGERLPAMDASGAPMPGDAVPLTEVSLP